MTALNRILHVDDDLDILEVSKMVLEVVGGFTIEQCSSGADALTTVLQFKPELILLDAMMPRMSGLEVLQELQKSPSTANIPVIFVTSKVKPSELEAFTAAGAIGVITKPFDPVELPNQIKDLWGKL
jgi:two-component system OmpR family response regulator